MIILKLLHRHVLHLHGDAVMPRWSSMRKVLAAYAGEKFAKDHGE